MILLIESIVLCVLFTIMVYIMSREPIKTLYNYPPKIQERVKSLEEYKDKIPTQENKIIAKSLASIFIIIIISLILRYVNGYTTFVEGFGYGFLLWTIVNIYDAVVMDIIWFCHDPYFVFKGTEDMVATVFAESGPRASHGNFFWGVYIGAYFMFVAATARFARNIVQVRKVTPYTVAGSLLLFGHIASSVAYFVIMMCGGNFAQ